MAPQLSQADRVRIVAMHEAGHKITHIERITGITRKTIRFWIRRAEETGGDLSAHHRQLYQRATTREQDAAIVEAHKERPFLNTATTASQYSVSQDTIRRRLKEGGLKNRKPAKKIVFTQAHAEARVGFCLQYYNFDWENNVVIFVDEKTFRSDKHGRSVLWRPDGTRYEVAHVLPNKTSGHVSLGFWGWISSAGPGELVEIDGRMNATEYVELLRDVMVPTVRLHHPEGTIYLVQDNSSVHNAGYASHAQKPSPDASPNPRAPLYRHFTEDLPDVDIDEIGAALRQIKNGKAPGEDGVASELLKATSTSCSRESSPIVWHAFQSPKQVQTVRQVVPMPKEYNQTDH
ncbi:transposase domain-containing protein [Phthorimaea operculella]|nr:transposase domain-containing protein [Phthorimaea operculella]